MKITCDYGEFEMFTYREPGSKRINRAVSVDSLVHSLGLSLKKLPNGPDVRYVDLQGRVLVPVHHLNTWLTVVKADPEVVNRLALCLCDGVSRDVGFLSYAHIHLQEALTALGGYYTETGLDAEYPVDEVEDSLYQIFCEFLQTGEYDPLLMKIDGREMTEAQAWMLSILETSAGRLIHKFIRERMEPDYILLFLQIQLKEKVFMIGEQVQEMAQTFTAPE
jgi:hypothetical protein